MGEKFIAILKGIGFSDIVDILIMTAVIYTLITYVKSSRALQLAKGILIIVAAFFISDLCHFYVFNWILGKLLDVGLIALVVVFQPELRRALEYLGRGKLAAGSQVVNREHVSKVVEDIVASIGYFSQRKEGALLVIERDTALLDIAESGTIVDAEISEQLIENIFYYGSPLHDGAAIIRDDRLYAAGCVLPLTENTNLSKDLGTRHRAGLGVSEVSDAIVLIVSEETGIISMAIDGKLSRFLDIKTVEKTLLAHYLKTEESGSFPFIQRLRRDKNAEK